MKKRLLPILLLSALFVIGGCANKGDSGKKDDEQGDKTQYGVSISNRTELGAEWFKGDAQRSLTLALTPEANPLAELGAGNLKVTSSAQTVVAVTGLGLTPVGVGKATIEVEYHGVKDSIELEVKESDPKVRYGTAHSGTEEDPFTNEDAVKVAIAAGATATSQKYYVRGVVDSFRDAPSSYGNVSFYFTPAEANGQKFLAYRVKLGEKGDTVTDEHIWIGGTATIYCNMYNYNGNTPENSSGWLVSCTGEKQTIQNHEVNVAEAIAACKALGKNGASDGKDTYDVTGYIVAKDGATFFLSDTKGAATFNKDTHFEVYNYTGENAGECTIDAKVKVSCTIKYYESSKDATNYAYETSAITAVTILEAGQEPAIEVKGAPALETLVAGTYKAGINQSTVNENCFLVGTLNEKKYAEVSQKWSEAVDVVVAAAEGGFTMKIGEKFLNPKINSDNKVEVALEDEAKVYQWNELAHTLTISLKVGEADAEPYYLGAYGSNRTLGFSKLSYLIKDNKVVAGQFGIQFYAKADLVDPTEVQLDQKASAVAGVEYNVAVRYNPYNADLSKLTWTSSDETVATVADGVVTPLKAGTTTIKAAVGETAVKDELELTVVEVNLGSVEAPLTVAQALEAAKTLQLTAGKFSPSKAFVKGVVEHTKDTFHNAYYGKINLVNGEDKLYCENTKSDEDKTAYENDEVIMSGYLTFDTTLKAPKMLKNSDNVYPAVEQIVTRGTSKVEIKADLEGVTVSELSKTSGTNLETFTFKVAASAGFKVSKVTVSNGPQTEELEAVDGVYTGTIKGNMVIAAEAADASLEVVEINVSKLDAFFESDNKSTTEHPFTVGGVNFGIKGAKTSSSAANAEAGTKYDYIMLMGGAIYNKTTLEGYFIASVEVTYTSGTGTSGAIIVSIGAAMDDTRAETGGTAPTKGGTVKVENEDESKGFFNICNVKTNNTQIASIKVTFKIKTAA